ncbi:MAG: hypothetical protein JWP87_5712 [Labilithrix sp.]|nr:hypothetical protein [Labilithrix sp.]
MTEVARDESDLLPSHQAASQICRAVSARWRQISRVVVAVALSSSLSSASADDTPAPPAALPIPPRSHAPEAPPEGWCGETAIQEGLLHYGVWAPQRIINKAGKPTHPDLYSPDIPVALSDLGVRYAFYPRGKGYEGFAAWIAKAVDEGDPVLAGVKILPTQHPEWGLDHFVLVVGHGAQGLLVNTTWGHRRWVADTTTPGLSFKNAFYAIRLTGIALAPNARAARLALLEEKEATVKLRVTCSGLTAGKAYRLERRERRTDEKPTWSEELRAERDRIEKVLTVDADRPARFQCVAPP